MSAVDEQIYADLETAYDRLSEGSAKARTIARNAQVQADVGEDLAKDVGFLGELRTYIDSKGRDAGDAVRSLTSNALFNAGEIVRKVGEFESSLDDEVHDASKRLDAALKAAGLHAVQYSKNEAASVLLALELRSLMQAVVMALTSPREWPSDVANCVQRIVAVMARQRIRWSSLGAQRTAPQNARPASVQTPPTELAPSQKLQSQSAKPTQQAKPKPQSVQRRQQDQTPPEQAKPQQQRRQAQKPPKPRIQLDVDASRSLDVRKQLQSARQLQSSILPVLEQRAMFGGSDDTDETQLLQTLLRVARYVSFVHDCAVETHPTVLWYRSLSNKRALDVRVASKVLHAAYELIDSRLVDAIGARALADAARKRLPDEILSKLEAGWALVDAGDFHRALVRALDAPDLSYGAAKLVQQYLEDRVETMSTEGWPHLQSDVVKVDPDERPPVVTYLRIRCTPPDRVNARFGVQVSGDRRSMRVTYDPADRRMYDDSLRAVQSSNGAKLRDACPATTHVYGPFTRVFMPYSANDAVARECDDLTNALVNGTSVFVLGYGASGAGKTSTLIFRKGANGDAGEPGVLVHVMNDPRVSHRYPSVWVNYTEFTASPSGGAARTGFDDFQEFRWDGSQYARVATGSSLGETLACAVDADRLARPTTNNPNSSRSHVLVQVKMGAADSRCSLFVGDFAGVENAFACASLDELVRLSKQYRVAGERGVKTESCRAADASQAGGAKPVPKGPPVSKSEVRKTSAAAAAAQKPAPAATQTPYELRTLAECDSLTDDDVFIITKTFGKSAGTVEDVRKYARIVGDGDEARGFVRDATEFARAFGALSDAGDEIVPPSASAKFTFGMNVNVPISAFETLLALNAAYRSGAVKSSEFQSAIKKAYGDNPNLPSTIKDVVDKVALANPHSKSVDIFGTKMSISSIALLDSVKSKDNKKFAGLPVGFFLAWIQYRKKWFEKRWAEATALREACECRAREGVFINASLAETRALLMNAIAKRTKDIGGSKPPFNALCVPSQCVSVATCFRGPTSTAGASARAKPGDIGAVKMRKALESALTDDAVVAVFCVLNVSRNANNPPPIAYVDASALRSEHDRLVRVDESRRLLQAVRQNDDAVAVGVAERLSASLGSDRVSERALGWIACAIANLAHRLDRSFVDGAQKLLDADLKDAESASERATALAKLLALVETSNAATAMGSLDFVERLAKRDWGVAICSVDPEATRSAFKSWVALGA
jgi:hypothetical protein